MQKIAAWLSVHLMPRDGKWRDLSVVEVENICIFLKANVSVLIDFNSITTLAVNMPNPFSFVCY